MYDEDTRLMLSAAQGDSSAFEKLYRKYLPLVHLYLKGLGCQTASVPDMAQEVFTRLWSHRQQYAAESTFKTYVLGYAHKIFLEEQRRQRRTKALADHLSRNLPHRTADTAGPEPEVAHAELRESLNQAILRLAVRHQEALRLYYNAVVLHGLSQPDKRLSCSRVERWMDLLVAKDPSLAAAQRASAMLHIRECPHCARKYQEIERLAGFLRRDWPYGAMNEAFLWRLANPVKRRGIIRAGWRDLQNRVPELARLEKRRYIRRMVRSSAALAACLALVLAILLNL